MATTYDGSRDEILAAFKTQWDAYTPAVVPGGVVPVVYYEGIGKPDRPDPTLAWAQTTIRHASGSQATLSDSAGKRRFEKIGLVTVQVFAPLTSGVAFGGELAKVAKAAFEGRSTASGVWFRNVRIVEVGLDGPWYQWNVVGEFRYDEFV